jgi:thymidylate synthase (FAD)
MGSDLSIVRGARISNGAAMPEWRGAADEKLINFLAENKHMSPFEHAVFQFYVKAPLFVVREWQRHRTFSYNERSGRYKKFEPEFYVPDRARVPDPNNKQSSVTWDGYIPEEEEHTTAWDKEQRSPTTGAPEGDLDFWMKMNLSPDVAYQRYETMLNMGIAREVARMVLPLNLYTEFIVTGNFRNWMHFLELRNTPEAQYEIRVYAKAIAHVLEEKMPISYRALTRVVD